MARRSSTVSAKRCSAPKHSNNLPLPELGERVGVRGKVKGYSTSSRNQARLLRKTFTDAELKLWQLLRNRNLEKLKFRRQHPVGSYVVDFVCLEPRLVIEVDGSQHVRQEQYDSKRTAYLEAAGFRVLRFWDNDVLARTESVAQAIDNALRCSPHPNPLPSNVGRGNL